MSGVIQGGWGYVAAAWGISLALLILYAGVLVRRLARAKREPRASGPGGPKSATDAPAETNAAPQ